MINKKVTYKGFKVPCPPNCELRKPACQDHCEKMIEAKKQYEEEKQRIKEMKYMNHILDMTPKRDRKR